MKVKSRKSAELTSINKQLVANLFSGPRAVRYAHKNEYIKKGLVFEIVDIELQEVGSDLWAITVQPYDGRGEEIITLSRNAKRDEEFWIARDYISDFGPMPNLRLVKYGSAYYFRRLVEQDTTNRNGILGLASQSSGSHRAAEINGTHA